MARWFRALMILCMFLAAASAAGWGEDSINPGTSADQPRTLRDCYALALKRSEEIAIHQELINETEGRFLQSLSGILPRVSFALSEKRQDGSGSSSFTLKEIPERRFTFSQPLFSGFKELAAMAGSRAERRERIEDKVRAEQLLFLDVSDAFYLLLEQREDLKTLATIHETLAGRVKELEDRERLGRSRRSEVVSVEAQLRRVEAEIERVRSQEITARQLLEFLTGLSSIGTIADSEPSLPPLTPEEDYVAKTSARPDVKASEEAWRVAEKQTAISQAKLFPTVGLEGNYYTKRVGVSQDVDWDVLLKVDVPIFQGGQTVGAIRESASRARQAKLRFEQVQRQATLDIRDTYAELQAAVARLDALEKALDAAEENYRLQVEDYRLNLVSNLDVLQTLQALQDATRDVTHARSEAERLYWQLRVATGEAP